MSFRTITPEEYRGNVFRDIGKRWMLVTAESDAGYNTMTASWGGMGILWNKPVAFVFIRPQRYTFEFAECAKSITLSFFGEEYRKVLNFCGSHSGRDCDKAKECGLTPVSDGGVYFAEADTVLTCTPLYSQSLAEQGFLDKSLLSNYNSGDYHKMYVCEIDSVKIKA